MPSNRPDLDNEQKRQMIQESAANVFLRESYEKASISLIAKEAGVTPNTIYWYFSDKDTLFASVVGELIEGLLELLLKKSKTHSIAECIKWLVGSLDVVSPFIVTVHERAEKSAVVADVHKNFHKSLENMLVELLRRKGVDERSIKPFITVISFTLEGMLMHATPRREQDKVIHFLLDSVGLKSRETKRET